jgi:uncharacterized repeat protein (TIGR03803 family)
VLEWQLEIAYRAFQVGHRNHLSFKKRRKEMTSSFRISCAGSLAILWRFAIAAQGASQYALSVVASFSTSDGYQPSSGLITDSQGNMFGTTGVSDNNTQSGTVYEIPAHANFISTLVGFRPTGGGPANPGGRLLLDAQGDLYGTSGNGGANNDGSVFEIPAGAHSATIITSFGGTNGLGPGCRAHNRDFRAIQRQHLRICGKVMTG